ncbi:MAG: M28 family peptidase, partial [Phycisphaerae bacterium]
MKRPAKLLLISMIAVATTLLHAAETATESAKTLSAAAARYLGHVDYLASDALNGRGFATPDIDKAADYIVEQWKLSGLQPAGDDDTWFQSFEITARKQLDAGEASLTLPGVSHPLKLGSDWTPLPFSAIGDAEGPIAFAGYGIEAPDHDYDDYLDIDPTGKILLIFRYEPRSNDPEASFGGEEGSEYSYFREKAATAAKHGAKGIIVINPPNHPNTVEDQLIAFDPWATRPTYDLPMIQISREVASEVVHALGLPNLATLQEELDGDRLSLSAEFPAQTVVMKTGVRPARGKNVVGLFRGDGTTDETIVVGAHYDHLGVSPARGDDKPQIHNGADDNASGTAGLIVLAQRLAQEMRPRRNVLFIA